MKRMQVFVLGITMFLLIGGLYAEKGKKYGAGVTLKETTKISSLLEHPGDFVGKKVKVAGTIVGVCAHKGCWIDIAGDKPFEKIRIKVNDGEIVFPLTAKGKTAVAEGVFEEIHVSKDQILAMKKRHAREQGEPFDSTSVKGGRTIYQIRGTGAVIE